MDGFLGTRAVLLRHSDLRLRFAFVEELDRFGITLIHNDEEFRAGDRHRIRLECPSRSVIRDAEVSIAGQGRVRCDWRGNPCEAFQGQESYEVPGGIYASIKDASGQTTMAQIATLRLEGPVFYAPASLDQDAILAIKIDFGEIPMMLTVRVEYSSYQLEEDRFRIVTEITEVARLDRTRWLKFLDLFAREAA